MAVPLVDRSMVKFEGRAAEAAAMLKSLANEKRLMILCKLLEHGEMSVLPLAEMVELSQSALSQHLAKLKDEGVVACRRDGQSMHYSLASADAMRMLKTLKSIYC
jgi:ArsR family transcriptional regulator, virulence genes transcriptional regulator